MRTLWLLLGVIYTFNVPNFAVPNTSSSLAPSTYPQNFIAPLLKFNASHNGSDLVILPYSKRNKRRSLKCHKKDRCSSSESLRPLCRCDKDCRMFGDCCDDIIIESSHLHLQKTYYYETDVSFTCQSLPQPLESFDVFMISKCPKGTSKNVELLCEKKISSNQYHYSLDIPVVSQTHKHKVYQNIHCAKCHNDMHVKELKAILSCTGDNVHTMSYNPSSLIWLLNKNNYCKLIIHYNLEDIRWCPKNVVNNCSYHMSSTEKECLHYGRSIVKVNDMYFKNVFCSICNGYNMSEIECLESTKLPDTYIQQKDNYNLILFQNYSNCLSTEFHDPLTGHCVGHNCELDNCSVRDTFPHIMSRIEAEKCAQHVFRSYDTRMYPLGSILLKRTEILVEFGDYELVGPKYAKVCSKIVADSFLTFILRRVTFTISLVCLALHMVIFILLPRKRNIPSMNLFSLTICLFICDLFFIFLFKLPQYPELCFISAMVLYYFVSAAFLWMNVLSIDIYRTFRSNTYKIASTKAFMQYSLYAWITPIFTTSIVGMIDKFSAKNFPLIPDFGSYTCWFNNKWGLVTFFTFPACIIFLINMSLYAMSMYVIIKQHNMGKLASSTTNLRSKPTNCKINQNTKTSDNNEKSNGSFRGKFECDKENFFKEKFKEKIQKKMRMNKKLSLRLALYSKLALIMGITWIFPLMNFYIRSVVLECLFIVFNGFQGAFIFIAFDCKKKVWHNLKQRLGLELPNQGMGSINQTSTAESTPRFENTNIRLTSYKMSTKSLQPQVDDTLTSV